MESKILLGLPLFLLAPEDHEEVLEQFNEGPSGGLHFFFQFEKPGTKGKKPELVYQAVSASQVLYYGAQTAFTLWLASLTLQFAWSFISPAPKKEDEYLAKAIADGVANAVADGVVADGVAKALKEQSASKSTVILSDEEK